MPRQSIAMLPEWCSVREAPTRPIPHALLMLPPAERFDKRTFVPGRWSQISSTFQAWTGKEYLAVWPVCYIDLDQMGRKP